MSRYHSYINSVVAILSAYKGEEPFASFLKKYFAQHKKFGSKDRKQVSHLCYCYFRLGKALPGIELEERVLIALFFCSSVPNEILQELRPAWNDKTEASFDEKLKHTGQSFLWNDIFPWQDEISEGIDELFFTLSHLEQPDLFLRLRPGKKEIVLQKLAAAKVDYKILSSHCIALPNASKIDSIIEIDKEAVIQDYSSQRTGRLLQNIKSKILNRKWSAWDCCAASGGKSIMAKDILGDIDLAVSDVRESILANLKKRFASAAITGYKSFVADLTSIVVIPANEKFDLVMADIPCTGSGTWGRTPEQLYYFGEKKISEYAALQKKILFSIMPHVASNGYLLYITCSVFKKENEEAVEFIERKSTLQLIKQEAFNGYDKKADTMFAALFKNSL